MRRKPESLSSAASKVQLHLLHLLQHRPDVDLKFSANVEESRDTGNQQDSFKLGHLNKSGNVRDGCTLLVSDGVPSQELCFWYDSF